MWRPGKGGKRERASTRAQAVTQGREETRSWEGCCRARGEDKSHPGDQF